MQRSQPYIKAFFVYKKHPQITRIHTDFNCISCICVNLRNLWEDPFYAA